MLGYESPEELMATITDIRAQLYVQPEHPPEAPQLLEGNDRQRFELEFYRKDGSTVWVSGNVRVVRDPDGQVLYYEGMAEDISERKRAEALEVFQAHQAEIALVILDVVMPRLGGRETARELKRRKPAVAVLLASGYDSPREAGKPPGEWETYKFVKKPYQIQDLARAVRAALEPHASEERSS